LSERRQTSPIAGHGLGKPACGKIRSDTDRVAIRTHFEAQGWDLWDEPWLRERLQRMAQQGYENQVSAVVAKLLLRGKVE
jgi:hypothetical protein